MNKKYIWIFSPLLLFGLIGLFAFSFSSDRLSSTDNTRQDSEQGLVQDNKKPVSNDSSQQASSSGSYGDSQGSSSANSFANASSSLAPSSKHKSDSVYEQSAKVSLDGVVDRSSDQKVTFSQNDDNYPLISYQTQAAPNDTNAVQDWTNDSGMQTVWDAGYGDNETTIAVIDSGFSLQHQEFTDRWLFNSGESGVTLSENPSQLNCTDQEIALDASCNLIDDDFDTIVDNESGAVGIENPSQLNCTDQELDLDKSCNLIDDDSNGYVDDNLGWDFINYDFSVEAGQTNPLGDTTGHGTQVSGIAAATGNNGVGIAGVNWYSKILPIQAIDDDGYGNTLTVSRAIDYAVARGVDVINLSLGSTEYDAYLRTAVDNAIEAGVVVVAAAGNDSCNCIRYPANFPEVYSVGAVDQSGDVASFSNTGAQMDLMASGVSLIAPTWVQAADNYYATAINGTSFSTPIVSGLLALLKSHQPDASWDELTALLSETADKAKLGSSSRSSGYGFGLLNASAAIARATQPASLDYVIQLGPQLTTEFLGSSRARVCDSSNKGSQAVYQLTFGRTNKYTVSELLNYQYSSDGWSSRRVGYVCSGLPTDVIDTIRSINLVSEIKNLHPKRGF